MALTLSTRRKPRFAMSITPLIDIVFQLLIFFLLTANYLQERVLDLELSGEAYAAEGIHNALIFVHVAPPAPSG